jgi:hypothetical protein
VVIKALNTVIITTMIFVLNASHGCHFGWRMVWAGCWDEGLGFV